VKPRTQNAVCRTTESSAPAGVRREDDLCEGPPSDPSRLFNRASWQRQEYHRHPRAKIDEAALKALIRNAVALNMSRPSNRNASA
jgi:hypothetical protein